MARRGTGMADAARALRPATNPAEAKELIQALGGAEPVEPRRGPGRPRTRPEPVETPPAPRWKLARLPMPTNAAEPEMNDQRVAVLVDLIAESVPLYAAAEGALISKQALERWLKAGVEAIEAGRSPNADPYAWFYSEVQRAIAEERVNRTRAMKAAKPGGWQMWAWLHERTDPDHYAVRKEKQAPGREAWIDELCEAMAASEVKAPLYSGDAESDASYSSLAPSSDSSR